MFGSSTTALPWRESGPARTSGASLAVKTLVLLPLVALLVFTVVGVQQKQQRLVSSPETITASEVKLQASVSVQPASTDDSDDDNEDGDDDSDDDWDSSDIDDGWPTTEWPAGAAPNCYSTDLPVLNGYDVVAYWSLSADADFGVRGSEEFATVYDTYTWWFASQENLDKFEADPEAYIPEWGGWCAWGIATEFVDSDEMDSGIARAVALNSDNALADTLQNDSYPGSFGFEWDAASDFMGPDSDPNSWLIHNDKLYIMHSPGVRDYFSAANIDALIAVGNARWDAWYPDTTDQQVYNTECFCAVVSYLSTGSYNCGHSGLSAVSKAWY